MKNDENNDYTLILTEVSKYFKQKYQRMLKNMDINDVKTIWYILKGRKS